MPQDIEKANGDKNAQGPEIPNQPRGLRVLFTPSYVAAISVGVILFFMAGVIIYDFVSPGGNGQWRTFQDCATRTLVILGAGIALSVAYLSPHRRKPGLSQHIVAGFIILGVILYSFPISSGNSMVTTSSWLINKISASI